MRRPDKKLTLVFVIAAIGLMAGCGSSGGSTGSSATGASAASSASTQATATTEPARVGGPPAKCNKDQLSAATKQAGGKLMDFKCADGWAAVDASKPEYEYTLVFEAEGQFWIPQDRKKVCPKPSQVPAAIYQQACNSN